MYIFALRRVLTSVLQELHGLTMNAFDIAIGNGISRHAKLVADFCSLVILIHNTLLGEITISSK